MQLWQVVVYFDLKHDKSTSLNQHPFAFTFHNTCEYLNVYSKQKEATFTCYILKRNTLIQ